MYILKLAFKIWVASLIVIVVASILSLQFTIKVNLQKKLQATLSPLISEAYIGYLQTPQIDGYILDILNAQLSSDNTSSNYILLDQISFSVLKLKSDFQPSVFDHTVNIQWHDLSGPQFASIKIEYQPNYFRWLLFFLISSFAFTGAIILFIVLQDPKGQRLLQVLKQEPWNWPDAIKAAFSSNKLIIDANKHSIIINNTQVILTKTPFFYYLWYAYRRVNDERNGWFVNPSAEKGNHDEAKVLIKLMEDHGGHSRAINDLEKYGIRAKTLDQNRNKIKDCMTTILGEDLAENFLFESKRDFNTGRYSYRLALKADKINII